MRDTTIASLDLYRFFLSACDCWSVRLETLPGEGWWYGTPFLINNLSATRQRSTMIGNVIVDDKMQCDEARQHSSV